LFLSLPTLAREETRKRRLTQETNDLTIAPLVELNPVPAASPPKCRAASIVADAPAREETRL
jgi:hypothetical protein